MNMTSVALTIVAVGLVSGCNGPAGRAEVNGLRAALSRSGRDDDLVLQLQWTSRSAPWLLEGIDQINRIIGIKNFDDLGFCIRADMQVVG